MTTEDAGATATTSEEVTQAARCPVMSHSFSAIGSMANEHWWPEQITLRPLAKNSPLIDPMDEEFDYASRVRHPRPRRGKGGHRRRDDDVAGVVAGGLRPLRSALHPDGVAQRRHLPHPRRPRGLLGRAPSASLRSTAGPTTPTSTRPAACCGR